MKAVKHQQTCLCDECNLKSCAAVKYCTGFSICSFTSNNNYLFLFYFT